MVAQVAVTCMLLSLNDTMTFGLTKKGHDHG